MILLKITKLHRKHLWQSVFFVYNVCERLFLFGSTRIMELIISEAALQRSSHEEVFSQESLWRAASIILTFFSWERKIMTTNVW